MARTNLGKVVITPKGEWSSSTTYEVIDVVTYNGSSYIAKQASTNIVPTNTAYWQLIASKGDQGTQGVQGLQGVKGDTGISISSIAKSYQLGSSATTVPTNTWLDNPPTAEQGKFLWTKIVITLENGVSQTAYSIGYYGIDATDAPLIIEASSVDYSGIKIPMLNGEQVLMLQNAFEGGRNVLVSYSNSGATFYVKVLQFYKLNTNDYHFDIDLYGTYKIEYVYDGNNVVVEHFLNLTDLPYAKKDGYYETFGYAREAGIASNLKNDEGKLLDPDVETSSGTIYADQPFTQRATAMTMNAYLNNELITVGSGYEQWKKEQAFSIVVNQSANLAYDVSFGTTRTINGMDITVYDGYMICNGTATDNIGIVKSANIIAGHKYINKGGKSNAFGRYDYYDPEIINLETATSNNDSYAITILSGTTYNNKKIPVYVIDLTQWFASRPEIATALNGDAGIKWFLQNYPQATTLGYDEGTIVDTEDYEYQTTGVNLWDEEWELGYWDNANGNPSTDITTEIRSKNSIKVFANTEYYFYGAKDGSAIVYYDINGNYINYHWFGASSTFTTPNNCSFIKINLGGNYGTTYNHDIQICNHFTETTVENTYHKYEIYKDRVSWAFTSTGKGKSAGKAADTKDYVIKKNIEKVSRVDLGTLDWAYSDLEGHKYFHANIVDIVVGQSTGIPNIICSKYVADTDNNVYYNKNDKTISIMDTQQRIFIYDSSYTDAATFKAAMSGVYLNYELATYIETDMTGDELDTNIPENDYGVERKVPLSGNMFSGSATTIFYQDNVLRQIYNNKTSIDNLQAKVNTEETTRSDTDTILQNAIGGTLRNILAEKANIDFDNTAFVDLGTLNWSYAGGVFGNQDLLSVGDKGLSTKYKRVDVVSTDTQPNNTIQVRAGLVYIKDTSYTDATTFKNAMKGVLLAYEKASS